MSCRHAWERFIVALCICSWLCRVRLFLLGFAKSQGRVHGPAASPLIGKHNSAFKNTFYGYHQGCEEKEMERYVFIRTLAVTPYFELATV